MAVENHDDSGTISPAGRFARMEASLDRIEAKLDSKADVADVVALTARVGVLEAVGSPEAQEALKTVKAVQEHLNDLEQGRSQSPQTQLLLSQFNQMGRDIADLKRDKEINVAVAEAERKAIKEVADARYNSLRTMVAVVSVIQMLVVVVVTAISAFHIFG